MRTEAESLRLAWQISSFRSRSLNSKLFLLIRIRTTEPSCQFRSVAPRKTLYACQSSLEVGTRPGTVDFVRDAGRGLRWQADGSVVGWT